MSGSSENLDFLLPSDNFGEVSNGGGLCQQSRNIGLYPEAARIQVWVPVRDYLSVSVHVSNEDSIVIVHGCEIFVFSSTTFYMTIPLRVDMKVVQ